MIVFDSRDYTAKSFWMATDHNFLLFQQFYEFYQFNQNNSKNLQPTNVYIVECGVDDCGWGWVKDNQELNKSAEFFIDSIKNYSLSENTIYQKVYGNNEFINKKDKVPEYKIYKLNLALDSNFVSQTKSIQAFYFTSYMYLNEKNDVFSYTVYGNDKILNNFCLWIIYLAVILAILSFLLVIILL